MRRLFGARFWEGSCDGFRERFWERSCDGFFEDYCDDSVASCFIRFEGGITDANCDGSCNDFCNGSSNRSSVGIGHGSFKGSWQNWYNWSKKLQEQQSTGGDDNSNILPVSAQQCSKQSANNNHIKIATTNRRQRQHNHLAVSASGKHSKRWQRPQKDIKITTIKPVVMATATSHRISTTVQQAVTNYVLRKQQSTGGESSIIILWCQHRHNVATSGDSNSKKYFI